MGLEVDKENSCLNCSNLTYICEGDFICSEGHGGLVIADWNYYPPMPCNGKDWEKQE